METVEIPLDPPLVSVSSIIAVEGEIKGRVSVSVPFLTYRNAP
jgi:hypothetical protein